MTIRRAMMVSMFFFFLIGFGMSLLLQNETEMAVAKKDELYQQIEEKKEEYERKAEDAKIDSVWKKTPGIVGRKVNVKASYDRMKKKGSFNEQLLVYETIQPRVTLEELPTAPIYRGHPDKNMVALLINVSWGEEYIPDMIEILSAKNVKATFFIDGAFAKDFTNLVQMIEEEGHTIGSHGYGHKDMAKLGISEARKNLELADELLFAVTQKDIAYFAPPSGSFNDATVQAADEMGMETILWTVDTIDWKKPTKDVLLDRVLNKVHKGATILMHPTEVTAQSLPELIDGIREKGYRIGSLPQLLSPER